MNKTCGQGKCYLLLTAAVFFLGYNSAASDLDAGSSAGQQGTRVQTREKTQRALSDHQMDDSDANKLIFKEGADALPFLLSALREGKNVERASRALAYLGGPDERKVLSDAIATEGHQERKALMSALLAGALVEPTSTEEWNFLRACLAEYKNQSDMFESFSAALALGVNASPEALDILQTVVTQGGSTTADNDALEEAMEAISWIKKRSSSTRATRPARTRSNSEEIKQTIMEDAFYAQKEREHFSIEDVVFSKDRRLALVSAEIYRNPKDAQGYDMVLERRSGGWKIRGVWFSWAA